MDKKRSYDNLKVGDLIVDDSKEIDWSKVLDLTEEEYKAYMDKKSRELHPELYS